MNQNKGTEDPELLLRSVEGEISALTQKAAEKPNAFAELVEALERRRKLEDHLLARQMIDTLKAHQQQRQVLNEREKDYRKKIKFLQSAAKERAGFIEEAQQHFLAAVQTLEKMNRLADTMRRLYAEVDGAPFILDPLSFSAVGSRLSNYLHSIGLSRWIPLQGHEGNSVHTSFKEDELKAQAAYILTK